MKRTIKFIAAALIFALALSVFMTAAFAGETETETITEATEATGPSQSAEPYLKARGIIADSCFLSRLFFQFFAISPSAGERVSHRRRANAIPITPIRARAPWFM